MKYSFIYKRITCYEVRLSGSDLSSGIQGRESCLGGDGQVLVSGCRVLQQGLWGELNAWAGMEAVELETQEKEEIEVGMVLFRQAAVALKLEGSNSDFIKRYWRGTGYFLIKDGCDGDCSEKVCG